MKRLVVVSNRVQSPTATRASAGGLAVGVLDALRASGGIWFGWSGEVGDRVDTAPKVQKSGRITTITVDLQRDEYEGYYGGFSNSTLWPLCHYRLDLASFDRNWYMSYRKVNQIFAERLGEYVRDDDLIWIQDYHLLPLAHELRQIGIRARMGFFLHIPFPAPEIWVALPWHEALVRALCECDVIGFQTEIDAHNFRAYVEREGIGEALNDTQMLVDGRKVDVDAYPIGIDVDSFVEMANSPEARRQGQRLRRSLMASELIIGVDRLDYSKGIDERLRAFEALLSNYPQHRGRVTYVQVSAPSREDVDEYVHIRHQVEQISGRINGKFGEFDWVPLRYINRSFSRRTLAGFFRLSLIGLVTPLRDGMNLVAKEYVAAQDPEEPGVLVLSRFAGAATRMEGALIVNPYDIEGVADSMHRVLTMPLEERRDRWRTLMTAVRQDDITTWRKAFVARLAGEREGVNA
ncbi:alpha,alpha-trehalose-phosphate synthase (UDP-forming) [Marinivivus vitaminiproducens]|uniref:alpha,alpha-trehalose-phosphate synthase (UDP-forming) n=1 Tax=Marinivivus vitaminiproducens TaxID=3035935 RepID=UPI0027A4811B|nr:alpha,alpha-trehalose-phosphate synthase (UDP-forming) [Geminicoccaceae bacterium SCSIO 64248]